MTTFDYTLLGTLFVLFIFNTVFQYRLGFSQGSKGGYAVGMYHAVNWLMKNEALEVDNKVTGQPVTSAELVAFIIKSDSFTDCRISNEKDMQTITKAFLEKDN